LPVFSSLTWTTDPTATTRREASARSRPSQLLGHDRDPRLEHRLLVLGVVVLGVLGDVAELTGFLDPLRYLTALLGGEVVELRLELFQPSGVRMTSLGN